MSLPNIPNITPNISIDREDAINLLLASVAMEEIGLSHILNAEGEKLQYFLKKKHQKLRDFMLINDSVNKTLRTIVKSQIMLHLKLEDIMLIDQNTCRDDWEEGCCSSSCQCNKDDWEEDSCSSSCQCNKGDWEEDSCSSSCQCNKGEWVKDCYDCRGIQPQQECWNSCKEKTFHTYCHDCREECVDNGCCCKDEDCHCCSCCRKEHVRCYCRCRKKDK